MKIHPFSNTNENKFSNGLVQLSSEAKYINIAVSYLQFTGICELLRITSHIPPENITIIFTDQLMITQPTAIQHAVEKGLKLRLYNGSHTFHPKVYIAYDSNKICTELLIGSANLSYSALHTSIEAGILISDHDTVDEFDIWFRNLAESLSHEVSIDSKWFDLYQNRWAKKSKERVKQSTSYREKIDQIEATEISDDILSSLNSPISTLGFDHARNNIRTIQFCREKLRDRTHEGKAKSELTLLGLLKKDGTLTELGSRCMRSASDQAFALEWCLWIKNTSDYDLFQINPSLLSFKKAASNFWRMETPISNYFFNQQKNITDKEILAVLKTIEIVANSRIYLNFELKDIESLASILSKGIPSLAQTSPALEEFLSNKGTRSWKGTDDRWTMMTAWKSLAKQSA
jgi:HKD family nuclease